MSADRSDNDDSYLGGSDRSASTDDSSERDWKDVGSAVLDYWKVGPSP